MPFHDWIRKIKSGSGSVTRLIPEPRSRGYTSSFDGTRIYWELHGPELKNSLTPHVFCYGLACSMNQWRYQLERYSKQHSCLLVDYRGHHESASPENPKLINISALARDIYAAIETQNYNGNYHVWGHSLGVNVALEFAVAFPERARTLNLCCGTLENPFSHMFHSNVMEKVINPLLGAVPLYPEFFYSSWEAALAKPDIAKFIVKHLGFNSNATTPQDVNTYIEAVSSVLPQTFFRLLSDLSKGYSRGIAPKVKSPACVIAGSKDHITPTKSQKFMAKMLPDAEYIEIATGSHNVQLDFGEYVCLKIEEVWKGRNLW